MRATWARRGRTPVLRHHLSNWKRLSMSAALGYDPRGGEAWLVFQMIPGTYNDVALIDFLTQLRGHLGTDKATLIWDGLPAHRSNVMRAWLRTQRHWLVVERLPAYGHDLNPVEPVWGNLKSRELANLCPDTIGEAAAHADVGLERIGSDTELCYSFLRQCGLAL
ncbi:MAG TPA: transposase [Acidimicrobiales bacterium]|nr:transposase [Acidimicrobiales bacterium]